MRCLPVILSLWLLFACPPVMASEVEHDFGMWAPVFLQLDAPKPHDKWYGMLVVQPRLDNNWQDLDQLLIFPNVGYRVNKNVALEAGYGWVGLPGSGEHRNFKAENRLWQGVMLTKNFGKLKAYNRARIEQRFLPGVDSTAVRARNMLGGRYYLKKDGPWFLSAYNEVLWNVSEHSEGPQAGFSQNRLYTGVGRHIGENLRVEGGYHMQVLNRQSPTPDLMGHQVLVMVLYQLR